MFKFQAVLAPIQPFLSRSVEKRGDQSRFKSLGLYINVGRSRYAFLGTLLSTAIIAFILWGSGMAATSAGTDRPAPQKK